MEPEPFIAKRENAIFKEILEFMRARLIVSNKKGIE